MVVLNGHFDGSQIVLDGPVPDGVAANTPVRVIFEDAARSESLAKVAKLAKPGGMPADFAEQHEHYSKGAPRR
jgi:hypothetical protein